jgi:hypothetical protein
MHDNEGRLIRLYTLLHFITHENILLLRKLVYNIYTITINHKGEYKVGAPHCSY